MTSVNIHLQSSMIFTVMPMMPMMPMATQHPQTHNQASQELFTGCIWTGYRLWPTGWPRVCRSLGASLGATWILLPILTNYSTRPRAPMGPTALMPTACCSLEPRQATAGAAREISLRPTPPQEGAYWHHLSSTSNRRTPRGSMGQKEGQ